MLDHVDNATIFTIFIIYPTGSVRNMEFSPSQIFFQIETQKLEFNEKAAPKVGSKDNLGHHAGGGEKKVGDLVSSRIDNFAILQVSFKIPLEI